MELELKYLAPYLPFRLKAKTKNHIQKINAISTDFVFFQNGYERYPFDEIKPILRPLSDINIFEEDLFELCKEFGTNTTDFTYSYTTILQNKIHNKPIVIYVFNFLISKHFDVFGLIEKDLAISIHDV